MHSIYPKKNKNWHTAYIYAISQDLTCALLTARIRKKEFLNKYLLRYIKYFNSLPRPIHRTARIITLVSELSKKNTLKKQVRYIQLAVSPLTVLLLLLLFLSSLGSHRFFFLSQDGSLSSRVLTLSVAVVVIIMLVLLLLNNNCCPNFNVSYYYCM